MKVSEEGGASGGLENSNTIECHSDSSRGQQQQHQQQRRFSAGANGVSSMMEYDLAVNPEERQRKGQCPSCGQQLYLVTSKSRFGFKFWQSSSNSINVRKKPLTVPGLVNRGQCVKCASPGNQPLDSKPPAVVAMTEQAPPPPLAASPGSSICDATGSVSSTTALYEGPHNAKGERHGKGTMKWANGDVYVGEFYQGSRQGAGTLHFADGSEYVGDWWNNYMHGSGTRRFLNGDVYVGDYRYSRREGSGRFYFTNGDLYYGNWKDDKMEGFGRYYYHSGQRFEGYFKDGKRSGKGKLQRTDGSLDLYRYEEDRRVGAGVRWSADRTKAWRLDLNRSGTVRTKKITVAEAVSLVYQIDGANTDAHGDGTPEDFAQMLTLEDTMEGGATPGASA